MKKSKLWIYVVVICFVCLFRGSLFRLLFSYEDCGKKTAEGNLSMALMKHIDSLAQRFNPQGIEEIIELSNEITKDQLSFSIDSREVDPNQLFPSGNTHCVGYARFFSAVCNRLIQVKMASSDYRCEAHCGKIHFLGFDIHQLFNKPNLRDHDFNIVRARAPLQSIGVDASLNEYFQIGTIRLSSP